MHVGSITNQAFSSGTVIQREIKTRYKTLDTVDETWKGFVTLPALHMPRITYSKSPELQKG